MAHQAICEVLEKCIEFDFFLSVNLQDETRDTCSPFIHPYDFVEYD